VLWETLLGGKPFWCQGKWILFPVRLGKSDSKGCWISQSKAETWRDHGGGSGRWWWCCPPPLRPPVSSGGTVVRPLPKSPPPRRQRRCCCNTRRRLHDPPCCCVGGCGGGTAASGVATMGGCHVKGPSVTAHPPSPPPCPLHCSSWQDQPRAERRTTTKPTTIKASEQKYYLCTISIYNYITIYV
jgi:hypothetical protein